MTIRSNKAVVGRRLVAVPITFDLLIDMMREGYHLTHEVKCIRGIPADAIYHGSFTDEYKGLGYLIFAHESFEEVPYNQHIPEFVVEHQAIYP